MWRIIKLFNKSGYIELIAEGKLEAEYFRDAVIENPEEANEPPGTRSQIIRYSDETHWLVEVHQYLRPDGSIGGKGKPEPKRIRIGRKTYVAEKKFGRARRS